MSRHIEVWADWHELGEPQLMGMLRASPSRGKEIFSFHYEPKWLKQNASRQLDPDLALVEGPQYLNPSQKPNFGMFLDSSPDRWGRLLMQRREAAQARKETRPARHLAETDYLLGVHDEQRAGAIRFRDVDVSDSWLNNDTRMATPPWALLRELQNASWMIQNDSSHDDSHYLEWLNLLMAPGSSIGGARPKAGVRDPNHDLWIAKFPGRSDERDMAVWEMLVHQLAREAGLNVADAELQSFGKGHRTFMTKRFDRVAGSANAKRIHFASAMTLLGRADGDNHTSGASYLELVEFIGRHGSHPASDMEELWRRIVFSIAVHNTDDHLRNHGFLLNEMGWKLSPAYDLNADPQGSGLSLNISETDNALEFDLAMEVSAMFRIKESRAVEILSHIRQTVATWPTKAKEWNIPKAEQELMKRAFL